ncbi:MAG: hypothetical protein IAG13_39020, partial [Deltaproteobacteria bacterium]|nr:hypothetical protein [Nannocystaceae bacterium]
MRTVRLRRLGARRFALLVGAMMVTITGCATRGDGEAASQRFELGEVHGVDVGGVFVLKAEQSSDRLVELQGDANLLPLVELDVQGGVLRARTLASTMPQL